MSAKLKAKAHPLLGTRTVSGNMIFIIEKEERLQLFKDKKDCGYHDFGTQWWINPDCPYAFKYLALDAMYPQDYFEQDKGHPDFQAANHLYGYMQKTYRELFDRRFQTILELGTGGGEITFQFHSDSLDYTAVEGTQCGVEKLISIGIEPDRILKRNLKFFSFKIFKEMAWAKTLLLSALIF